MTALSISVDITQENPVCYNCDSCKVVGRELTLTPTYTIATTVNPSSTINYLLTDSSGNTLLNQTVSITNSSPEDGSLLTAVYTPTVIDNLTLVTTINNDGVLLVESQIISVCDYVCITTLDDPHTFNVCNGHVTDSIKVLVNYLDNSEVPGYETANTIVSGGSLNLVLPSDGVFIVIVNKIDDTLIGKYIIIDDYDIISCIQQRIQDIICTDCGCDKCKDYCKERFELNRILPLAFTYGVIANKEVSLNTSYDVLDNDKITQLNTIQTLIEKLSTYCSACKSSDIENTSIVSKYNDSGCGCK